MRLPKGLQAALGLVAALAASQLAAATASASDTQLAMAQDDVHLDANPGLTLAQFRDLGVGVVRVFVRWSAIAPNPTAMRRPAFNAADPNAYPAGSWTTLDSIVRDAQQNGIVVDFDVAGGAPRWAERAGIPPAGIKDLNYAWYPSASQYGLFVRALGARYSGTFTPAPNCPDVEAQCKASATPLPRVDYWEIWNEPNFGEDLAPQAIDGSSLSVAPAMYRGLVDAGWAALQATGHRDDVIVIGGLADSGVSGPPSPSHPQGLPGNYAQTKPLQFLRTLYCVDENYRRLTGAVARAAGCPASAAGYAGFRRQHPGLFAASGFGIHPYPRNLAPNQPLGNDPDFVGFEEIPRLESTLDRLQSMYRSSTRFEIYNNEYGYITDPPPRADSSPRGTGHYVTPATAAVYLNWAEYLSWRNPRIATMRPVPAV